MKLLAGFAVLMAMIGTLAVLGGAASAQSARREVNVTSDSAPGWLPSITQEQQALKATNGYLSAIDAEEYQRAYAMMADINRNDRPLAEFIQQNHEFHEQSGPLVQRKILKVTWTKDPAAAPFPGVYAAVDIVTRFAKVDRYCGYLILYQKPSGGDFEVMREEINYIDNDTAKKIEQEQSRAALDRSWATLAANCPNYGSTGSSTSTP